MNATTRRLNAAVLGALPIKKGLKTRNRAVSGSKTAILEPSESQSQQAVIRWWASAHAGFGLPEIALMAFPLQGARTARNGARLKAEGMRAGTPDMFLMVPYLPAWHGLWIEMKTSSGRLTDSQKAFHDAVLKQGYAYALCRSSDQAIRMIQNYLEI